MQSCLLRRSLRIQLIFGTGSASTSRSASVAAAVPKPANGEQCPHGAFFFRTWVEQYTIKNDRGEGRIPKRRNRRIYPDSPGRGIFKSFFVPKMCNHCYKSPCVQVCPVGATYEALKGWCWWTRNIASDADIASRPVLTDAANPARRRAW